MQLVFKKNILPFFSLILILFTVLACQSDAIDDLGDEEPMVPEARTYPGVDERLWPYFERFEAEGQARGKEIDLVKAGITGAIEDLEGEHVAGLCRFYNGFQNNHVIMDSEFWNRTNDLFKEFIVFHELGHCYLNRDHREDAYTNGRCVSLMRSGTGTCIDNYNTASRSNYINELFSIQGSN